MLAPGTRNDGAASRPAAAVALAVPQASCGRRPPAPMGPRRDPVPRAAPPSAWSPRGLPQEKQERRWPKFGKNPHLQRQSPWRCWCATAAVLLPLAPRAEESRPRDPPLPARPRLPPLSSRRSRSRNANKRSRKPASRSPPSARRWGMVARAKPPPPWWAASLRRAASSAISARSACLRRLARRCHACSPAVAPAAAGSREGREDDGRGRGAAARGRGAPSGRGRRRSGCSAARSRTRAASGHEARRRGPGAPSAKGEAPGTDSRKPDHTTGGRPPMAALPTCGPIRL